MPTSPHIPRLSLVGAGPGDPELITLKALRVLAEADVVLYDALVHPDLLTHARKGALCVFVGKRAGQPSWSQEHIQELSVTYAKRYGHVVRLKGGDPFVFGRGLEEIQYAAQHGIPSQVIPGISSALAVPASAGIPLTHRGLSESFWVVTGTTRAGTLSQDLALAAQSTATVVVLMGVQHLPEITRLFSQLRGGHTPAAILQNGTLPEARSLIATADTLVQSADAEGFSSPAILVFGEVVSSTQWVGLQTQLAAIA